MYGRGVFGMRPYRIMWIRSILIAATLVASLSALAGGTYQQPEDFLMETFAGQPPPPQAVWLSGALRDEVENLLGHRYPSLRIRYWAQETLSAWILEEVGKDLPITTGIVVRDGRIEQIKVLVFRESRGGEVRYPFFTDQFKNSKLQEDKQLDHRIDNISGATMSVRALVKQARLALLLHQHVSKLHAAP